jgi:hypothetical protein
MILQIQRHLKKISLILIILAIFLSVNIAPLSAGKCERAFASCVYDALRSIPFFSEVYLQTGFCINGWIFCLKYMQN